MASLTPEVREYVAVQQLGSPIKAYGPGTVATIIVSLFFLIFAVIWTAISLFIFDGFLLLPGLFSFVDAMHLNPVSFFPDSPVSTIFSIMGVVFPLIGVLIFGFGLWAIAQAIYNRRMRAVVCTYGVVFARPSGIESFRWQDVLTTFHKVDVSTSRSYNQSTHQTTTTTTVHHTYTVHCHDGRKFVFKSPLARVQELGEDIEVQVARMKHAQGYIR